MRVIGYVRVSTASQAESGAGLEVQRATIEAECARRGWELVEIIEDAGASGRSMKRRPGIKRALNTLATGDAEVLMASKLDRLCRSTRDFAEMLDQSRYYGWRLVVLDCNVDTSTPSGELLAGVMSQFAQYESRIISERTKDGLAVKKSQGVKIGRRVQLSEQAVRLMIEQRNTGASYAKIAEHLNAEGVPTAQGGARWYPSTVQQTLSRVEVAA